jgi:TfoX/Sxy family transcriptional regulator of competence genes
MASDVKFVEFVMDQLSNSGDVSVKKMFGEYGVYADGKLFGLICDNRLLIKPTLAGKEFLGENLVEAPPYPGAKPCFLIEEKLEDRDWLGDLVRVTVKELPMPKPKKPLKPKNPMNK